jgi:zinc protease
MLFRAASFFKVLSLVLVLFWGTAILWASDITPRKVTSPKGVTAWLIEDHNIPIIAMSFSFKGSLLEEPAGKEGIAALMLYLLEEGAGRYSANDYQDSRDNISLRNAVSPKISGLNFSVKMLSKYKADSFELVGISLNKPHFSEGKIKLVVGQMAMGIAHRKLNQQKKLSQILQKILFKDHLYGRDVYSNVESLKSITQADLKEFARKNLVKKRLVIAVVGAVTEDELKILLDKTFGDLEEGTRATIIPDVQINLTNVVYSTAQEQENILVKFAGKALKISDKGLHASSVLNQILGADVLSSRLGKKLRTELNLTYDIHTEFLNFEKSGEYIGQFNCNNADTVRAMKAVEGIFKDIFENGVTALELKEAKEYLIGSYFLRFGTSSYIAEQLLHVVENDFPKNYFMIRNDLIEQVSLDDVNTLARTMLNPENIVWIVGGKEKGLEEFGLPVVKDLAVVKANEK